VEWFQDRDALPAGATARLALKVTLNKEFHINSHVPSEDYLIPTNVESEPLAGLVPGKWEYPEGEMKRFPFSETPLRVYEGAFWIRGAVAASGDAIPGRREWRVRLRYQACTREKCLPPRREEILIPIEIVGAGTAVHPLHPEIFPPERK
jgi:hypothetical protein